MSFNIHRLYSSVEIIYEDLMEVIDDTGLHRGSADLENWGDVTHFDVTRKDDTLTLTPVSQDADHKHLAPATLEANISTDRVEVASSSSGRSSSGWGDFGEDEATTYEQLKEIAVFEHSSETILQASLFRKEAFQILEKIALNSRSGTLSAIVEDTDDIRAVHITGGERQSSVEQTLKIIGDIQRSTTVLKDYFETDIYYGVDIDSSDVFVIDSSTRESFVEDGPDRISLIQSLLSSDDFQPYEVTEINRYLIAIPAGWTRAQSGTSEETSAWNWFSNQYKAISEYLESHESELKNRKIGDGDWWELLSADDTDVIKEEKLICTESEGRIRSLLDRGTHYVDSSCYIIPKWDPYVLTVLNSTLLSDIYEIYDMEMFDQELPELPIPDLSDASQDEIIQSENLFQECREWLSGTSSDRPIGRCLDADDTVKQQLLRQLGQERAEPESDFGKSSNFTELVDELVYSLYGLNQDEQESLQLYLP